MNMYQAPATPLTAKQKNLYVAGFLGAILAGCVGLLMAYAPPQPARASACMGVDEFNSRARQIGASASLANGLRLRDMSPAMQATASGAIVLQEMKDQHRSACRDLAALWGQ